MREYKFRGFATAPEKWVYGNLMEKYDPTKKENVIWCRFIQDKALSMEQVAIESVGQFTGLKDKNGNLIFEGDVIQAIGSEGTRIQHEIIFDDGSFCSKNLIYDNIGKLTQNWITDLGFEVIGNIYEKDRVKK